MLVFFDRNNRNSTTLNFIEEKQKGQTDPCRPHVYVFHNSLQVQRTAVLNFHNLINLRFKESVQNW